jgi:Fur family transcriptional regulator, peroxide stress response regulator
MNLAAKKKYPIKLTPQRLAIIEYLEGNKAHPSAADIYKVVSEQYPMMSLATVYNTLEALKEKTHILELSIDPQKKRFDPNTKPHHHLICMGCKTITDVHRNFTLPLTDDEKCDYDIIRNHVDFYGFCPKCKQKTRSKK